MIATTLFYAGATIALFSVGLGMLARGRRRHRPRWLLVAAAGVGVSLLGLAVPVPDVVVTASHTRLDALVPRYQFHERHTLVVSADPYAVDRAIRAVTADEIRLYRLLTWIRRAGRDGPDGLLDAPRGVPMLTLATRTGFHRLSDDPAREIVLGASLPVSAVAQADARAARDAHSEPPFRPVAVGYANAVMSFRIVPDGRGGSIVSTETRVITGDAGSRRRFSLYWRLIYPGSALIRRSWLAAIERRAESDRKARHGLVTPGGILPGAVTSP